jgi:hypothetical protein
VAFDQVATFPGSVMSYDERRDGPHTPGAGRRGRPLATMHESLTRRCCDSGASAREAASPAVTVQGRMRRALLAAVATVVLIVAGVGAAYGLGVDLPVLGRRAPVPGLTGIEWRIAAFEEGGGRWEVPSTVDGTLYVEARTYTATLCNHIGGTLVIHGSTLAVVEGLSTAMACEGDLGRTEMLFHRVMGAGTVAWASAGDVLRLTGAGVTAEWRPRAPFPTAELSRHLGSAAADPAPWQFGSVAGDETGRVPYDRPRTLRWESRPSPDGPWVTRDVPAGSLADTSRTPAPPPAAHLLTDGTRQFVVALTPLETGFPRTARYERPDFATTALTRVHAGNQTAFAGLVDGPSGTVVVVEPDGTQFARLGPLAP